MELASSFAASMMQFVAEDDVLTAPVGVDTPEGYAVAGVNTSLMIVTLVREGSDAERNGMSVIAYDRAMKMG